MKKTNKGVVVVVTAAWHVLCFDHNLKLMWENSLQAEFPRHARVAEVAVLVSNATMFEGDRGSVVVGGRVELGDLDSEDEDPLDEELAHEDMMLGHRGGRRVAPDDLADANDAGGRGKGKGVGVDRSRHFNYYAFDGATGSTRWRHESEDFHRDLDGLADRLTPQHNYRLTAQASNGHHYGEAACRDFRESVVVNALPHAWREREDTALRLAHFRRHRTAKGARVSRWDPGASRRWARRVVPRVPSTPTPSRAPSPGRSTGRGGAPALPPVPIDAAAAGTRPTGRSARSTARPPTSSSRTRRAASRSSICTAGRLCARWPCPPAASTRT